MASIIEFGQTRGRYFGHSIMRKVLLVLGAVFVANATLGIRVGHALLEESDLANLPPWCARMVGKTNADPHDAWGVKTFGQQLWPHMHHYCWGLADLNKGRLLDAVHNFKYLANHLPANNRFGPELYVNIGDTYRKMNDYGKAALAYTRAELYDPRYVSAYLAHSSLLRQLNDDKAAADILRQGLRYVPDSPRLVGALKAIEQ